MDGLRGIAVLAIVFLHYVVHHLHTTPGGMLAYGQKYLMFLWIGVDAFFVLSGFLIGGILLDQRTAPNYFAVFYTRRSLRIFPPYLVLLLAWVISGFFADHPGMKWLLEPNFPVWPYWLYLQNLWMAQAGGTGPNFVGATWSLAVEEQFYLLLPIWVRLMPARVLPVTLVAGVLLAPVLRAIMATLGPNWEEAQARLLPSRWDSLLMGSLVAWAVRDQRLRTALGRWQGLLRGSLGAVVCAMALIPIVLTKVQPGTSPWLAFSMHLVVAVNFAVLLLLLRIGGLPGLAAILRCRWMEFLGRISYSLYLFHMAILGLTFALLLRKEPILREPLDWLVMLGAFGLTTLLATVSWKCFEGPLVAYGHRLQYAPSHSTHPASLA